MYNPKTLTLFLFLSIVIASSSVFSQTVTGKLADMEKDRMLILKNGEYYTGKLIAVLYEGVIFDPNVELTLKNPPPGFYPYKSILHIREMDGRTYTNAMLEKTAEMSIKEYDLPEEKKIIMKQKIAFPFSINLEYGVSESSQKDAMDKTNYHTVYYTNTGSKINGAIDLNYQFSKHLGLGCRFDYKLFNVDKKIVEDSTRTGYGYTLANTTIDQIRMMAPCTPKVNIMYNFNNIELAGSAMFGPALLKIYSQVDDVLSNKHGTFWGVSAGLNYLISRQLSLGVAYQYYNYNFDYGPNNTFDFDKMAVQSINGSIKYRFNWCMIDFLY